MPVSAMKKGAAKTLKGATVLILLLAVFFFAVNYLVGERGYFRYRKLEAEKQTLQTQIDVLKADNERLSGEIDLLKSDPEHIERLAREQGLVKDGEIIYQYKHQELASTEE